MIYGRLLRGYDGLKACSGPKRSSGARNGNGILDGVRTEETDTLGKLLFCRILSSQVVYATFLLLVPFSLPHSSLRLFSSHFPAPSSRHWHYLNTESGWFKRSLKRVDEKLAITLLDDVDEI